MVAPGNDPTLVAIGNPLLPFGVACDVCCVLVVVEGEGVEFGGVAFDNGDAGTGVGSGGLEREEGGGVLGLGGRCSWGDFSGLGGWGAGETITWLYYIYTVLQAGTLRQSGPCVCNQDTSLIRTPH